MALTSVVVDERLIKDRMTPARDVISVYTNNVSTIMYWKCTQKWKTLVAYLRVWAQFRLKIHAPSFQLHRHKYICRMITSVLVHLWSFKNERYSFLHSFPSITFLFVKGMQFCGLWKTSRILCLHKVVMFPGSSYIRNNTSRSKCNRQHICSCWAGIKFCFLQLCTNTIYQLQLHNLPFAHAPVGLYALL